MLVSKLGNRFSVFSVSFIRAYSAAAPSGVPVTEGPSSSSPKEERSVAPHIQALVDQIANLPLLEVADLNYALKKKLNLPDAPVMPAGMVMSAAREFYLYYLKFIYEHFKVHINMVQLLLILCGINISIVCFSSCSRSSRG